LKQKKNFFWTSSKTSKTREKKNVFKSHPPIRLTMTTPPYLRLYKHALESIFSHLELSDLASISATCLAWSAAVSSMRPIGASAGRKRRLDPQSMSASRLTRHVSEIYLKDSSLSASKVSSLCEIIKQSTSLTALDLCFNLIGSCDASAIAEAIAQSKSPLVKLDLCGNEIGFVGASAIAEAIKKSKSLLATVDLSYNRISAECASSFVETIKASKSLTDVNLRGNAIGDVGVSNIAKAAKQSTSLTTLDLRCNQISTRDESFIADAIAQIKSRAIVILIETKG